MKSPSELKEQISSLEVEVMEKLSQLAELRRELPRETVKDYDLVGPGNKPVQLSELFGASDDLIVIHNMGTSCSYCTLWGDGLNGWLPHFENRAAFAMVSPDSPEVQAAFAEERGWRFRMLSDAAKTFTDDMGFIRENEGERGPWPGYSTFHREQDGRILRVAYDSFGPGDPYCAVWHMLAHLDTGVDGWEPKFVY